MARTRSTPGAGPTIRRARRLVACLITLGGAAYAVVAYGQKLAEVALDELREPDDG